MTKIILHLTLKVYSSTRACCLCDEVSPLIWIWLFRSGSSSLSSSGPGSESESGSVFRSRFRTERFSGISGIRGRMAWLFLFNTLKSFETLVWNIKRQVILSTFSSCVEVKWHQTDISNGTDPKAHLVTHYYDFAIVNLWKETFFLNTNIFAQ